jgi:NitT/TauT family transport system ATP-binding protein
MIQIKNVSKSFEQLKVLDNISFSASSAEITSIIGPSGSGKTTLLRCITGLENHFSGEVLLSGLAQDVYLTDRRIAFVTQQYSNFLWMTVTQNIEIGLSKQNKSKHESQEIVTKLISDLQLEDFEDYYVNKLSGGMRQRVAIGRALAQDTEFLAMDEPFGALDYQTRESLQLLIKRINKEYHKTILFVTHDIEEAIFLSNKIVLLSKIPSQIIKQYEVPRYVEADTEMLRFNESFVSLRKTVELDLKSITNDR